MKVKADYTFVLTRVMYPAFIHRNNCTTKTFMGYRNKIKKNYDRSSM